VSSAVELALSRRRPLMWLQITTSGAFVVRPPPQKQPQHEPRIHDPSRGQGVHASIAALYRLGLWVTRSFGKVQDDRLRCRCPQQRFWSCRLSRPASCPCPLLACDFHVVSPCQFQVFLDIFEHGPPVHPRSGRGCALMGKPTARPRDYPLFANAEIDK
jgi:hypothetical protein